MPPASSLASDAAAQSVPAHTAQSWMNEVIEAFCARSIRCEQFRELGLCKAFWYGQIAADVGLPAVSAVSRGTASFDPAQAETCLSQLAGSACGRSIRPIEAYAACIDVFDGNVPDAGSCVDDVECPRHSYCELIAPHECAGINCVTMPYSCAGVCTPLPAANNCRKNEDCAPEQVCSFSMVAGLAQGAGECRAVRAPGHSGQQPGFPVGCAPGFGPAGGPAPGAGCSPLLEEGATCDDFVGPDCAVGLTCLRVPGAVQGTCMKAPKLGEPCHEVYECGAQYLASDIICDVSGTHTCVRKPKVGPCVVVDVYNSCDPSASYCDESDGVGTCKPWRGVGEHCESLTQNHLATCGWGESCEEICLPSLARPCSL